ncbi:MAG TPA: hypothetical protein DIU39_09540, partial [Flavobacteriales bacterium]|nr:hypothetical protein [Flavobacteriales bacterium]
SIDTNAFDGVSIVVNLAGQSIAGKRWTKEYKNKILQSRVNSSLTLIKGLEESGAQLDLFIGASAVGYYGMKLSNHRFAEDDLPGNDFLATTCIAWEKNYEKFYKHSKYVSVLRFGLILSGKGGFFPKIEKSFKLGFGVSLAPGNQIMSIVHIEDVVRFIFYLIQNPEKSSVYNVVSDIQPTYDEMAKTIAKHFGKPLLPFRVPVWLLNLFLGEQHKMLTTGVAINNDKLKNAGFNLKYFRLVDALQNLI